MANKPKASAAAKAAADIATKLAATVAAVNSNTPFYATKEEMAELIKHPAGQLVEFNEAYKDPTNPAKIAFRATAFGMTFNPNAPASGAAPAGGSPWGAPPSGAPSTAAPPSGNVPKFDDGIAMPAARRGGRGQNTYGFEHMNVGQSFFLPKTDDNPNPSKRIASTVSSASKRLAPKSYMVRSVEGGARVWRTA